VGDDNMTFKLIIRYICNGCRSEKIYEYGSEVNNPRIRSRAELLRDGWLWESAVSQICDKCQEVRDSLRSRRNKGD